LRDVSKRKIKNQRKGIEWLLWTRKESNGELKHSNLIIWEPQKKMAVRRMAIEWSAPEKKMKRMVKKNEFKKNQRVWEGEMKKELNDVIGETTMIEEQ